MKPKEVTTHLTLRNAVSQAELAYNTFQAQEPDVPEGRETLTPTERFHKLWEEISAFTDDPESDPIAKYTPDRYVTDSESDQVYSLCFHLIDWDGGPTIDTEWRDMTTRDVVEERLQEEKLWQDSSFVLKALADLEWSVITYQAASSESPPVM